MNYCYAGVEPIGVLFLVLRGVTCKFQFTSFRTVINYNIKIFDKNAEMSEFGYLSDGQ